MPNLTGTANQVNLSASGTGSLTGANNIQLSLPQSIHTAASPTFAGLTCTDNVAIGASIDNAIGLSVGGAITSGVGQTGLAVLPTAVGATDWLLGAWVQCSASGAATFGFVAALYVDTAAEVAGASITTQYGLFMESMTGADANYAIYTNAGAVRFGDNVTCAVDLTVTGNVALCGTGSYGGGTGVVSIQNAATGPSSNPTGGGILYAQGGALKWRGSSGTITGIASA